MSYSGGYDGNSNSKGSDNRVSVEFTCKPQLDSAWSYDAQCRVLNNFNAEPDLSFKESSVKDVSDKGRERAAARLQEALEASLQRAPSPPRKKHKVASAHSSSPQAAVAAHFGELAIPDSEVRAEVTELLSQLREIRETRANRALSVDILRQLELKEVSVKCLKTTKIAVELNQPYWRGGMVTEEVRERATSLVRKWRAMYRAEAGTSDAVSEAANKQTLSRRCRNVAMDLEEASYAHQQKVSKYVEIIEGVVDHLLRDSVAVRSIMRGVTSTKDFVQRAASELEQHKERERLLPIEQGA